MASFSPQFLDEIRARLSVSSVVGRRVKLNRRGHEFVGLSPFSNERTPSFTVNDDKGFYHCFSTGEHGDVISFVMKTQNLTFPEAVERLAEEAGLEMPRQSAQEAQQQQRSATLRDAVEMAAAIYEKTLYAPEGRKALAYLRDRGLTDETIKRFRLGYAAPGLKQALLKKNVPEDVLMESRLISPGKDGRDSFDFFRDRVTFPIFDLRGRPVAFGGRVMNPDEQPKYLNSPDTPLFHKGQIVYGLALARTSAAEKKEIIAVEGYMDVIALAQAGFTNAVAPLGTAMTETQIELLWRIAPEPIMCFDGDKAGQRAALRAAERALPMLKPGFSLRFALLPAGKDPDDICRRQGRGAMENYLSSAISLSEVVWLNLIESFPQGTPEQRAKLSNAVSEKVREIGDPIVQKQYKNLFDTRLSQELRSAPFQTKGNTRFKPRFDAFGRKLTNSIERIPYQRDVSLSGKIVSADDLRSRETRERILIATLIAHPELFDHVEERLGAMNFFDPRLDSLRQTAVIHIAQSPELDFAILSAHLSSVGYAAEIATLLHPEVYQHAAFARPTAPLDQATAGWDHTFALCQRAALEADLERAELELVENPTNEALAIRDALLRQAQQFLTEEE